MSKEKNRIFNTLKDERFLFADTALLEEKDPKNPALSIHAGSSRKANEILYALIDHASSEDILEHRQVVEETLEEEADLAAERAEVIQFLTANKAEFDPKADIEDLKTLKGKVEEEAAKIQEAADAQETENIRKELTEKKVEFNPRLGLKKLRELLKAIPGKKPEKPAAKTKEEKEAAKVEAAEIREFLNEHNVKFEKKSGLLKLRELKVTTEKALQKKADTEEEAQIRKAFEDREIEINEQTLEGLRILNTALALWIEDPEKNPKPGEDTPGSEAAPAADKAEAAAADKTESPEAEEEKKSE